jgi:hypothetical protein
MTRSTPVAVRIASIASTPRAIFDHYGDKGFVIGQRRFANTNAR